MAPPTISCNVIDRRNGQPAIGMTVLLISLQPQSEHGEFSAVTNSEGFIFEWPGSSVPAITLLDFLFNNNYPTTTWQMGFLTRDYFYPDHPSYIVADVNFTLNRGEQAPHITLFVDTHGFDTWVAPWSHHQQRLEEPRRKFQKFSKEQNDALMEFFVDEPYPDSATYLRLSSKLDLSRKQTMSWFGRQRRKKKSLLQQHHSADADVSMGTTGEKKSLEMVEVANCNTSTVETSTIAEPVSVMAMDKDSVFLSGVPLRRSSRCAKKVTSNHQGMV